MEIAQVQVLDQNESAPPNEMQVSENEEVVRKSYCRYGSGCTHINDPTHSIKFCHPAPPKLNKEQLKSQFICNECGYATSQLKYLQLHLQRKTAWSNLSLVGCRINCLVDSKEWHEGFVLQFHKSGKHFVEFRLANEKRWLIMKKIAFYILERPVVINKDGSEFKDDDESDSLAPIEDNWVFCEDISLDYAFAQSVLFKIYGNTIQETGHLTRGHTCLTDADRLNAQYVKGSLLYGELLPRGVNKAFGAKRLDVQSASVLFDLGMGTGKILIQAFLQCKNLRYLFGIELSATRYKIAEDALLKMVRLLGPDSYHVQMNPGKFIIVTEVVRLHPAKLDENGNPIGPARSTSAKKDDDDSGDAEEGKSQTSDPSGEKEEDEYVERVLHMQCGNMFDVKNIGTADIVMMETDIPLELHARLLALLSAMKDDAKVLTYLDLKRIWQNTHLIFKQVDVNRHQADRYPTSWSVQRGHHFFLWNKISAAQREKAQQQQQQQAPSWENWGNSVNRGISRLVSGTSGTSAPTPSSSSSSATAAAAVVVATQNTPGGGTTDSPIALNRAYSPHRGSNGMARVNSNGRTGQRYTSSPEGVADGAVPGSPPGTGSGGGDEYDVANGRCLPYLIMACIFGRGGRSRGQHSSGRKPKNVFRVKESESIRESAVVPVNADGSRVTTPRRIAVEPLSLPGRRSPGPGHGGESPLSGVSGASPQQSPMTPQRLGEQGNSPGAPPFAPKANHGGDAMAIAQVGAAAASSSSPDHPNPQYPQQQQNQQNQQQGRTNMNKYGSIKHRHHHHRENDPAERISTMGLESVRLRSPRSPRGDEEGEPSPRSKKKDKRDRGDRGDKGSRSERGGGGSPVNVADTMTDTVGVQQALQLAEKPPYPYVASSTSQQDLAGLPNTTSSSSSPSPRSRGSTSPRG